MSRIVFIGVLSFVVSLLLTMVARTLAPRLGMVSRPSGDRWNARAVPLLGGVPIALATILPAALFDAWHPSVLAIGGVALFLAAVGLVDDRHSLKPSTKAVAQLAGACVLVVAGAQLQVTPWAIVNILLTLLWVVGITNAFNLLDNMDGLCAGIGAIATLAFLVERVSGAAVIPPDAFYAAALLGALLAFLIYNFHPASIFMGDTGSLFIGASLAGLTTVQQGALGTSLWSVLLVPALILMIPIFDTVYVTVMRKAAGRPASQGGRDHTSHRLVALGFSERRAVVFLYGLAAIGGALAIAVRQFGIEHVNVIIGVVLIGVLLLAVRLGHIRVYEDTDAAGAANSGLTPLIATLMYKKRLFEIALDCVLIVLAYYGAYWIRFESLGPSDRNFYFGVFLQSMPVVLACKLAGLFLAGAYGGVWRYFGLSDLTTYLRGLVYGSVMSVIALLFLFRFEHLSRGAFVIDFMFLTLLLLGARTSFRVIGEAGQRGNRSGRKVVVYGAGAGGGFAIREMLGNAAYDLMPVALIDDDPALQGARLYGYQVRGGVDDLPDLIAAYDVEVVVVSSSQIDPERLERLREICEATGTEMIRLEIRLDSLQPVRR